MPQSQTQKCSLIEAVELDRLYTYPDNASRKLNAARDNARLLPHFPSADDFLAVEEDEGEEGIGANPDEDYDYLQLAAAMDGSDNDSASDSDSDDSAPSDAEKPDASGARLWTDLGSGIRV